MPGISRIDNKLPVKRMELPMQDPNRRCFSRLDFNTEVVLRFQGLEIRRQSLNISQGGIFVDGDPLGLGEQMTLEFRLPDLPEIIRAEAIVRWVGRGEIRGIGLQFTGLRAIEVWAVNQLYLRARRQSG